ncbi:MAG TPA: hypothetical protein VEV15_13115, partial [Flavisolibacter sp.]|nr:hypothetical protein [Flavisolibacter sp.]
MKTPTLSISKDKKQIQGTVYLTGSKSESNRALIMQALSAGKVQVENLSKAADTVTLNHILQFKSATIDVGPAGTAMRFLTAYAALQDGETVLTGSERMQQRPIGILVDALRELGADIQYQAKEGFPPLKISGPLKQQKTEIKIDGNISSQYISALLLIAPALPQGLILQIEGELTSKPY